LTPQDKHLNLFFHSMLIKKLLKPHSKMMPL
jgi:hypothetical protein